MSGGHEYDHLGLSTVVAPFSLLMIHRPGTRDSLWFFRKRFLMCVLSLPASAARFSGMVSGKSRAARLFRLASRKEV